MTITEKIADKKSKIEKYNEEIKKKTAMIRTLQQEISELETLEIKGILSESDITLDELKRILSQRGAK